MQALCRECVLRMWPCVVAMRSISLWSAQVLHRLSYSSCTTGSWHAFPLEHRPVSFDIRQGHEEQAEAFYTTYTLERNLEGHRGSEVSFCTARLSNLGLHICSR